MERHSIGAVSHLVRLMVVVGMCASLGCSGGGDGEQFRNATSADLENLLFIFSDGRAFVPALANTEVRLIISDFDNDGDGNPNTASFALTAAAGSAGGTVTIGSCNLSISISTFDAATFSGLQAQQTILLNPCRVDPADGKLQVQNATTGETSTSNPSDRIPPRNVAFIITTDFSTGSYTVIRLAGGRTFPDINLGGIHSDAIARFFDGRIYGVNRLGVDSIQLIDPQQGYTTPTNGELSVGNGTNPQDIAFVSTSKAYVSRLASAQLLVIDPTTLASLGQVDLSALTKPNDADGRPEVARMLVHNGLLYVALQHIDFNTPFPFTKVAPGEIAVIDPATNTVTTVIALNGTNPESFLQFSSALNRLLVGSVGNFGVNDGGIEAVDPVTNTVDPEFVISEADIGGDITHFEVVSATKGYAVITDANFGNSLVSFDPSTGQRLATLLAVPPPVFFSHFAINSRNELYLAVTDLTTPTPGVRIFNTTDDTEITTGPKSVGALPPVYILFIE